MNLIGDQWIPVCYKNGKSMQIGLRQLFEDADIISDLSTNPPQRIALIKLLICIIQTGLNGPKNEIEWHRCRKHIASSSIDYLAQRISKFDLYGKNPFMQISELTAEKMPFLDKLFETSRGDNELFLEQCAKDGLVFSDAEKALALIVYHNFSASGRVGQSNWGNVKYSDSSFSAPCFNNLYVFLRGSSLLDTLWLNIIPTNETTLYHGLPIWDMMPTDSSDKNAFLNNYETSMGRLVPLSRLVKLFPSGSNCIVGPVPKNYKLRNAPSTYRDPYLTLFIGKDNSLKYCRINPHKHIWRELSSILSIQDRGEQHSALNLINLKRSGLQQVDLWCGGLAKGNKQAKIVDSVEWIYNIPIKLIGEKSLSKYQKGVCFADKFENNLKAVVKCYKKSLIELKGSKGKNKDVDFWTPKALHIFWSILDIKSPLLLKLSNDTCDLSLWKKEVWSAMYQAFEKACPHETPRQILAFSKAKVLLKQK